MSFRGFKGNTAADCKDYAAAHLLKGERFLRAGGSISSREGKKHRILGEGSHQNFHFPIPGTGRSQERPSRPGGKFGMQEFQSAGLGEFSFDIYPVPG